MKNFFKKIWPSKRKWMQLYFALLFNANIKGFINIAGLENGKIYQGQTKNVCIPGLNCYSCPGAVGACPLGSLQNAMAAKNHGTIYYVCGTLLLYCILFGRMICGWMCPFGFIQELLHKIKTPKIKKSPVTRVLSYFKYVVLVFFVLIVPLLYAFHETPLPAFCKYICPAGTLLGGIGLLSNPFNAGELARLGPLFTWKFLLMVSILVGCVFIFRLFCRFICPLGALYGLFNKFSVFGIQVDDHKCTNCGLCTAKCKVDIKTVGDRECISCGDCVSVCPSKAISFKGIKVADPSPKNKKKQLLVKSIAAVLMLAVLGGTIFYFWKTTPAIPQKTPTQTQTQNPDTDTTVEYTLGYMPGNLCYSFDAEIVTANGISGQTIDPTKTGKITVINFWGTWCGPCVAELPYFNQLAQEHDVTVIAIHSALSRETAPEFIKNNYPETNMIFAQDVDNDINGEFYDLLGGIGAFPYTLVLNEEGVVIASFPSSVTYDDLVKAISE